MRLNIITVNSGWILSKIAERLRDNLPECVECLVSTTPRIGYDTYFYCDIQNCYHRYKEMMPSATHIGYMTHADQDSAEWLREMFDNQGAWSLDGIKCMGRRYEEMVRNIGYTGPTSIIVPPVNDESFQPRKVHLVIANRGGYPGYGHDFMFKLPEYPSPGVGIDWQDFLRRRYKFTFIGNGWEEVVDHYNHLKIEVDHKRDGDIIYPDAYVEAYREADYVLLPLLWAGGPICALEAGLAGVPLIASNVGLIGYEIEPEYKFEPGDTHGLLKILHEVAMKKVVRRLKIQELTGDWKHYAERINDFIWDCKK